MSQENVEFVRRLWKAFNRADVPALQEMSDKNLEFVSALTDVDTATYRGPETWKVYFDRMRETWEEWQVEDLQVFDGGEDRVVAVARLVGKGKTSGAPVEHEIGLAYTIRQGKLWRLRSYLDPGKAFEAVGLSGRRGVS